MPRLRLRHQLLAGAAFAAVGLACAATALASGAGSPIRSPPLRPVARAQPTRRAATGRIRYAPRSNANGVALIARITKAYERVPGVTVTVRGPIDGAFTEVLNGGVVVAEQFAGSGSSGTTVLVASRGSPTFAKEPRTACWRVLAETSPQTLHDVGHPFVSFLQGATVGAPHSVPNGWTLSLNGSGIGAVVTVDKALLVQSITLTHGSEHAAEDLHNLDRTPVLSVPQPRC